ncbi:MAG: BatA domain-containing protein [Deltaproteobacteria bacterium]
MSFLVPLYLAGLAALSLPFIFHLVRRTPRGRQEFSSLMFLAPTSPRLTRRSRLDQLLLLALRLTALALLAFAFARPFLREAAALTPESLTGRRVALLIDTSASMRRADLWQQVLHKAGKELDELNPQDDVALFTFNDRLTTLVDFEREKDAPLPGKPQIVRQQLQRLSPGWGGTDLGTALTTVAGEIDSATDARQSLLEPQIVVVSDFQKGSRIEALQAFEWPERVPVVLRAVAPQKTTNAFVHVLRDEEEEGDVRDVRVRVVNAADSASDQFYVSWAGDPGETRAGEIGVYVPAGQSRVVRLPRVAGTKADRIVLRGDDHDFDNTFYVTPPAVQQASVLYVGADAAGLLHFLKLAVTNDPLRTVEVRTPAAGAPPSLGEPAPKLAVVSQALIPAWEAVLRPWVEGGGMLLMVPASQEAAASLPLFFEDVEVGAAGKGRESDYLLLGDINFAHPLFAPFANPRYSDFTKIHFWKHRPLSLKTPAATKVVARFDNGDPAVLERTLGTGRVLALTSGWQPDDSQLALSSKFVPLIGGLLDLACGGVATPASVSIGVAVPVPPPSATRTTVVAPDGREVPLAPEARTFPATDQPGIFRVISGTTETRFAVNLPAVECDTAPLDAEQLEQRGVRFGSGLTRAERIEQVRQQRDTELEGRQKVWHWLIAAALAVLIFETWWAGRAERKIVDTEAA